MKELLQKFHLWMVIYGDTDFDDSLYELREAVAELKRLATKASEIYLKDYESVSRPAVTEDEELLKIITNATIGLGWEICVEKGSDEIRGLVIGTPEYTSSVLDTRSAVTDECGWILDNDGVYDTDCGQSIADVPRPGICPACGKEIHIGFSAKQTFDLK